MDVLGADPDVAVQLRQRVADGGEADERWADDPGDPGDAGPAGDASGPARRRRRASCASSSSPPRSRLASRESCQSGSGRVDGASVPEWRGCRPAGRRRASFARGAPPESGSVARRSRRSSARWTADRCAPRRSASSARLASGVARLASATRRTDDWLTGQAAVGVEDGDRVELAARGADRPLQVGRLGIEHPVELPAKGARDLARLDLEERAGRAEPPEEGPDRLTALRRDDTASAADPPRGRQAELGEPGRQRWRLVGRDDELEVRSAARQAQRAAGEEPPAQPGRAAVLGSRGPVERGRGRLPFAAASEADREPGDGRARGRPRAGRAPPPRPSGRTTRDGSTAASSSRSAVTRSRSARLIGGQAVRPTDRRRCPRLALERPEQGCGEPRRIVVVGIVRVDHVVEDEPRHRLDVRRPAQPDRLGRPVGRRPSPRTRCWPGRRRSDPGAGVRGQRLDVAGEVEPGRLADLGRHVADEHPRRLGGQDRVADRPGSAGSAAGSCRGCPDPARSAPPRAIAARASSDGADVGRREPDALDARSFA